MSNHTLTTTAPRPTTTTRYAGWRRVAAAAAIGAPLAELLAVALGVDHTNDTERQLDIIAAHVGSFTAMVLLEQLCFLLAAVVAVAVGLRLAGARGGRLAAAGAALTVIGASASTNGIGGPMPTLARQTDRAAALHFIHHIGPIYAPNQALAILLQLGLVVTLAAVWRSGRVAWPWPAAALVGLVASVFIGSGRIENIAAMLVVTGGFIGVARFLGSDLD